MEISIGLEQLRTASSSDSSSSEGSSPRLSPKNLIKKSTLALIRKMSNFDLTEETDYVNPITLLKVHQVVILICSILLMILLLQIPTILYYANSPSSPSVGSIAGFDINFKTCTVSNKILAIRYSVLPFHFYHNFAHTIRSCVPRIRSNTPRIRKTTP